MGDCMSRESAASGEHGDSKPLANDVESQETPKWTNNDTAWDSMAHLPKHSRIFFNDLTIAHDGGMSEIGHKDDLWYPSRYIGSIVLFVFVFYNIFFVITVDIGLMSDDAGGEQEYLITAAILSPLLAKFGIDVGKSPRKIVGGLELFLLVALTTATLFNVLCILVTKGYTRWRAVVLVTWELLPELSAFSSLKLLQKIVPQQLSYELNYILWYDYSFLNLLFFVISRPIILVVGLDCFLIKFRAAIAFVDPPDHADEVSHQRVIGAIIFMNQVLAVVQITKTIKWRLYRFVFGGEDGVMSDAEKVRQNVWEAMTSQAIYESYPFPKNLALMLTWCDDDFQMLALNSPEPEKEVK